MNFTPFQNITAQIEQPLLNGVDRVSDRMLAAIGGPLHWALVIYIAWLGYGIAFGRLTEPLRDTWGRIGKAAAIAGLLTAGTYNPWIRDFFLNGLSNDLLGTITGTVSPQAFDQVWGVAFEGGLAVWKSLSWTDIGFQMLIVLYWLMALLASALGFLIYMISHLLLGLYVSLGPVFIATYFFAATRSLAERWVGSVLTMIVLQFLTVSLLVLLIPAENQMLAGIGTVGVLGDAIAKIHALFAAIVLFAVAIGVLIQLPGAASALAGGFHYHAGSIARATFGTAAKFGRSAAGGVHQVLANAGVGAQRRLTASHPPGRPLSKGP